MKRIYGVVLSICIALAGVSAMIFGISNSSVMAKQPNALETAIVVNTLGDELNNDGDCSLREAITAANDNIATDACPAGDVVMTDTITFDVAGVITLNTQLDVNAGGPLHIDGGGAITVSGNDSVRVFYVSTDAEVTLSYLTISDGYVNEGTSGGGGIYNSGGALTIISSTLSGNSVGSVGGGSGGGIYNQYGTLTIISSTLSGNSSPYTGGGIYYFGEKFSIINSTLLGNTSGVGGGIVNSGAMTIISSTLSGNISTDNGGGISHWYSDLTIISSTLSGNSAVSDGGGIFNYGGTLTITNSTLSGNSSISSGGGIYIDWGSLTVSSSTLTANSANSGGGIYNLSGLLTIISSTLSGNSAEIGGGININSEIMTVTNCTLSDNSAVEYGGAIRNNFSILNVTNSTMSGNSANYGGGIYNMGGQVIIGGSIVANSPSGSNCNGDPVLDDGYNLEDADTCGFDPSNGSLTNTDPLLGPLQDNGGSTFTHALLDGSPAIDAGDNAQCPLTDQRGVPRPLDGNGDGEAVCDMGAYEFQQGIDLFPNSQSGSGVPSTNINYNIQLYNWTSITDTYSLALGSHTWDTELSESQTEPLEPGETTIFTVTVLIPVDSDWYEIDSVVLTATSQTSPTLFFATAQVSTQTYAPPQISVDPLSLESTQYTNQVTTQPLTISNGNGVTLTYTIVEPVPWLSVDPQSGSIPTNSSSSVQVAFDATAMQPGAYETTLLVNSNDPLKPFVEVPVSMTVAAVAPLSVEIAGPPAGLVGESYIFTVTVEPLSTTLPVEYSWQASGQETTVHTGGLSDTLAYTWEGPGTQLITVIATNLSGSVVATHTVAITDVPIGGLLASNDSLTLLGTPTTFTATVEAGTNVTYSWDFGDETAGEGATVSHTYAPAGVYTATVTASNSAGSVQASTMVQVVIPTTLVYLPVIMQEFPVSTEAIYWRREE